MPNCGTKTISIQLLALAGLAIAGLSWGATHPAAPQEKGWSVPEAAKKLKNPVPATAASIAAGKAVYQQKCASCHGETGKGDGEEASMYSVKPAGFSDAKIMGQMTDGELFWKISEGRRPMPAFKRQLSEQARWQVASYIRTFSKSSP